MELTPLRYFSALAHARHMTRAAATLGVTQPALSTMLKKLEREVGTQLVLRAGRGIELTQAGELFHKHAQETLRHAQAGIDAVRQLAGLEAGVIRVGGGATATGALLPRVISALRRKHPGLRFSVREAGSNAVALAVLSGELDLGIVTLPLDLPVSAGEASKLVRVPLVEDELRLLVHQGHRLADRGRTPGFAWKDLTGEAIVGFEAGSAVREAIDFAALRAGVRLEYVMELRSIEAIKQMVKAGIGVGFVSVLTLPGPTTEAPDTARANARGLALACSDGPLTRRLAIVKRRDRPLGPGPALCERMLLDLRHERTPRRGTLGAR